MSVQVLGACGEQVWVHEGVWYGDEEGLDVRCVLLDCLPEACGVLEEVSACPPVEDLEEQQRDV